MNLNVHLFEQTFTQCLLLACPGVVRARERFVAQPKLRAAPVPAGNVRARRARYGIWDQPAGT
jgi:hypothetical protein